MKIWEALDIYANVERETRHHLESFPETSTPRLILNSLPQECEFHLHSEPHQLPTSPRSQHGGQWGHPDIITSIWPHHVYVWLVLGSRQCCLHKPVISFCGSQSYSYYPQRVYDLKHSQERTKEHHVNSHYSLQMCVCTWIASVEAGSVQEPVGFLAHFSGQRQPVTFP